MIAPHVGQPGRSNTLGTEKCWRGDDYLKEVGSRAVLRTIPDEHRDRLIKAGYV